MVKMVAGMVLIQFVGYMVSRQMGCDIQNLSLEFLTKPDSNQSPPRQRLTKKLKFRL